MSFISMDLSYLYLGSVYNPDPVLSFKTFTLFMNILRILYKPLYFNWMHTCLTCSRLFPLYLR